MEQPGVLRHVHARAEHVVGVETGEVDVAPHQQHLHCGILAGKNRGAMQATGQRRPHPRDGAEKLEMAHMRRQQPRGQKDQ